jgi:CHRD domain
MRRDPLLLWVAGCLLAVSTTWAAWAYAADKPIDDLWGGRRTFAADLSADHQTTLTHGDGKGTVKMVFDIASKAITWDVTYEGLTSPVTAVRLHGPAQAGTNGGPIMDLGVGGLVSPIQGKSAIAAGHVQYLLLGWTYVSIATRRYPGGEIRGKVDVVPPPEMADRRSHTR